MSHFPRYAIYYASAHHSDLDRFGAGHLGYDAWTGEDVPFPDSVVKAAPDWREITQDPRKYGFHATLKAPMALADGKSEAELLAACAAFAETPRSVPVIKPVVQSISGFIAVVPGEPSLELEKLAADCVSAFDGFRALLTPEDRARRNPAKLTPRQRDYLDRWGYPYVMEEFRFHMTLTGRLDAGRREPILAMLQDRFASLGIASLGIASLGIERLGIERLAIDRLALFRQNDSAARFRIIGQWPLLAASTGRSGTSS
jgi:putative phosphonate metabolism protein